MTAERKKAATDLVCDPCILANAADPTIPEGADYFVVCAPEDMYDSCVACFTRLINERQRRKA